MLLKWKTSVVEMQSFFWYRWSSPDSEMKKMGCLAAPSTDYRVKAAKMDAYKVLETILQVCVTLWKCNAALGIHGNLWAFPTFSSSSFIPFPSHYLLLWLRTLTNRFYWASSALMWKNGSFSKKLASETENWLSRDLNCSLSLASH